MNEYMIFYKDKNGELSHNWWNGSTLESAIDSASYDLQNNGEVDVVKTVKSYLSKEHEEKNDMSETRKTEIIQKIISSEIIVGKDIEEINRTKNNYIQSFLLGWITEEDLQWILESK